MPVSRSTAVISLLVVAVFVATPPPASAVIEDVLDIIHIVKEIATGVLKAWDIVQQTPLTQNIDLPLMREKQRKVLQRLKEVTRQIHQTEDKYSEHVAMAVQSINSFLNTNTQLLTKMNEITDTMHSISSRFQQMQQYETHQEKLEMSTLITFAQWTVSPNAYSVHHLMDRLNLMLLGAEEKMNVTTSMLAMLAQSYEFSLKTSRHESPRLQRVRNHCHYVAPFLMNSQNLMNGWRQLNNLRFNATHDEPVLLA